MCITFRPRVIPIVIMILSILLLPCTSIEISTSYPYKIDDVKLLGTYADGTILSQLYVNDTELLHLLYPNGTSIVNLNGTCPGFCNKYPLNPNYILMRYIEGVIIMDWTGKIITIRSMKTDPQSFITSRKNDSRFLVAEINQTHFLYTEYTFNGEEIIINISKTKNESLENLKIEYGEIKKVIPLNDKWGFY